MFAIIPSLFFNLYYLPFKQAIKLPIILYKPHYYRLNGKVIIDSAISFGMIRLGLPSTSIYPLNGIAWDCCGTIIFKGRCAIGANSSIVVEEKGVLHFGDNVSSSTSTKIDCENNITIGKDVRLGWNVTIMDSGKHRLKDMEGNFISKGYGEVRIGANNWFGSNCFVMQNATTPDFCISAAGSIINRDLSKLPTHCMIAGSPAKLVKEGIWRDMNDCSITVE